jgi:hypothetical protein
MPGGGQDPLTSAIGCHPHGARSTDGSQSMSFGCQPRPAMQRWLPLSTEAISVHLNSYRQPNDFTRLSHTSGTSPAPATLRQALRTSPRRLGSPWGGVGTRGGPPLCFAIAPRSMSPAEAAPSSSAGHPRPRSRTGCTPSGARRTAPRLRPAVGVQHCLVLAIPAQHFERAHAEQEPTPAWRDLRA